MEKDKNNKKDKISFRKFLGVLGWSIKFTFRLSPFGAVSELVIRIVLDLSPLFNAYIFARLLDKIIIVAGGRSSLNDLFPLLGILLFYNLAISVFEYSFSYFRQVINNAAIFKAPQFLYEHIALLGVQTLESPEVANKIQRCQEMIKMVGNDFERTAIFFSRAITLFSAAIIILHTIPIVALVVFVSLLPELVLNRIFMRKNWRLHLTETENRRRANWALGSLIDTSSLHEITITSAYKYLGNVFKSFGDYFTNADLKLFKQWQGYGFLLNIVSEIAIIFGYLIILKNIFYGIISIGIGTFQIRSLDIFTGNLRRVINSFSNLYERSLRIYEVKAIFDMKPMVNDGTNELSELPSPPDIRFESIGFKYPNSDNYVIKDLNLHIEPGEKIAIVGENGAGKTTLVKLLARFYKVDKGEVLLDEKNINDIKINSWYKNLSVLFQDYNTYSYLTLKENIYLGESYKALDMDKIKVAVEKANASSFISMYKNGYDQVLSEKFKGGTRPSTGQWQKIAIARFFYRNSPVVVFDEPTASIDAVSEAEIFGQIYDFFTGKTVIIISHRFSTVRNADKIYVLDKGEIVESGSHSQLMKSKGRYYKAFNIQAKGYK